MLVLPTSLVAIASTIAANDPSAAATIAMTISTADCAAASTDIFANSIVSTTTTTTTTVPAGATIFLQSTSTLISSVYISLLNSSNTAQQKLLPGNNIHNLGEAWAFLSATVSRVSETLASAKSSDFEPMVLDNNPFTALSTVALVTASDMIPFVPCQPLAISLGAKYGAWAFPVCVVGQTLAGVLAFQSSRKVSDTDRVQKVLDSLGENGQLRFQKFKTESLLGGSDDNDDGGSERTTVTTTAVSDEGTVFFALVGLRLAPFFPFSAGNYLLGGATDVGLRPFVLATILGCMFSNAVSVLLGMGGAELFMNTASN